MTDARIKDVEVEPGVPFDMGGGRKLKTMAGSGGIVVFDDSTDVVALCARIMQFYAHESCGQCTPCREGSGWLARVCKRLARGRGRGGRRRAAGQHRQRHRRQHHLRARRRGGLADAGLPHQVPRRLRGAHQAQDHRDPSGGQGERRRERPAAATAHRPATRSSSGSCAAMIAFFAVFTITRKNPVTAVMSLVATFFGLAAMYATLSAHFLAVIQVLVYAGAIMVLFIFVVMILNREEVDAAVVARPRCACWASLAGVYLLRQVRRHRGGRHADRRAGRPVRRPSAPSASSATCCSATSSTRSRRSRCCCWSPSSAAWWSRARTRKRSPPSAPPSTASRSTSWPATTTRARPRTPAPGRAPLAAMPTNYYLILSFVLFLIGTAGVLLRRNALIVLMGIELQLNGGNLALLAFSRAARRREGARVRLPDHRAGGGRGGGRPGDPGRPLPRPADRQPRRNHADEALTETPP